MAKNYFKDPSEGQLDDIRNRIQKFAVRCTSNKKEQDLIINFVQQMFRQFPKEFDLIDLNTTIRYCHGIIRAVAFSDKPDFEKLSKIQYLLNNPC